MSSLAPAGACHETAAGRFAAPASMPGFIAAFVPAPAAAAIQTAPNPATEGTARRAECFR